MNPIRPEEWRRAIDGEDLPPLPPQLLQNRLDAWMIWAAFVTALVVAVVWSR